MIRVTLGDVIAEHEGYPHATYYWCHEVRIKSALEGGYRVELDRVTTINGAPVEDQPDLTINTDQSIYIEPQEGEEE